MLIGGGGVKSEAKYLLNLNHFKTSGDYITNPNVCSPNCDFSIQKCCCSLKLILQANFPQKLREGEEGEGTKRERERGGEGDKQLNMVERIVLVAVNGRKRLTHVRVVAHGSAIPRSRLGNTL